MKTRWSSFFNRPAIAGVMLPFLLVAMFANSRAQTFPRQDLRFTDNWKFYLGDASGAQATNFSDASWTTVCLPHTARVESAISHGSWDYYQGYYWYRKSFTPDTSWKGRKVFLEVEAGMQTTQVWVNGTMQLTYHGGYNPFTLDITAIWLRPDERYCHAASTTPRARNSRPAPNTAISIITADCTDMSTCT